MDYEWSGNRFQEVNFRILKFEGGLSENQPNFSTWLDLAVSRGTGDFIEFMEPFESM